ncbi:MAG: RNA methyltransferase [Lachnospiraceae bacterium]|nr:RNA methyltransferase [Lachnospiraceae bacterium]
MGADADVRLIPYELAGGQGAQMVDTRKLIRSITPGQSVSILIGPEGGFTEEEVQKAQEAGFIPITLGHRILRTETAAMTVLSWLVLQLER